MLDPHHGSQKLQVEENTSVVSTILFQCVVRVCVCAYVRYCIHSVHEKNGTPKLA